MPDTAPGTAKDLIARAKRAETRRAPWKSQLADAFEFCAPDMDSGFQGIETVGSKRRARVFDASPIVAVEDAASATHATLTPPYERFFDLRPAPALKAAVEDQGGRDAALQLEQIYERATDQIFSHLHGSNFHAALGAAYMQEKISTGAVLFNEAAAGSAVAFTFEPLPLSCLYPEADTVPEIRTVWRIDRYPRELVARRWPNATIPRELAERPGQEMRTVEIIDGQVYDPALEAYRYVVLWPEGEQILFEETMATGPMILFRAATAPGEVLGRGRVLSVLADVRTLNKTVELILKNAALAVTGMWQADDDGVLNPATVRLVPGTIIPKAVGSSGLTPLAAPGDFNVAELLLSDLRERIRRAIVGPELPEMERRRDVTATEVERRWSEVQLLRVPGLLRLWSELVIPLTRRAADILSRRGEIERIPGIGSWVQVLPAGRMLQMQHLSDVMRMTSALQQAAAVFPAGVSHAVDETEAVAWMLERGGFPPTLLRPFAQRQQAAEQARQAAEMQMAAEAAGKIAPAAQAAGAGMAQAVMGEETMR